MIAFLKGAMPYTLVAGRLWGSMARYGLVFSSQGAGNMTFVVKTAFGENSVHTRRPISKLYFTHNFNPFMFPIITLHWYT